MRSDKIIEPIILSSQRNTVILIGEQAAWTRMTTPFSEIWQRLRERLFPNRLGIRDFELDERRSQLILAKAAREHRSVKDIMGEITDTYFIRESNEEICKRAWLDLSPREQQITALMCRGYSTAAIAERLVISPETVKSHIKNINNKFGVTHRSDVIHMLSDWDFRKYDRRRK
jgi:DNA-binding CsgD family transcriptional regulator